MYSGMCVSVCIVVTVTDESGQRLPNVMCVQKKYANFVQSIFEWQKIE